MSRRHRRHRPPEPRLRKEPTVLTPELQAAWERKLRASGFQDAEDHKPGCEPMLKRWTGGDSSFDRNSHVGAFDQTSLQWAVQRRPLIGSRSAGNRDRHFGALEGRLARAEYYRLVGLFLHDHRFRSRLDKRVWAWHAEGRSGRSIARQLGIPDGRVKRIVRRLAKLMLTPARPDIAKKP